MGEAMKVAQLVRRGVAEGVAPGIAFAASQGGAPPLTWVAGRLSASADAVSATPEVVFDLASLTKPLSTTLWCLRLVDAGTLTLMTPVSEQVAVADPQLAATPLWRLLTHTSGLPAHRPYFAGLGPHAAQTERHDHARSALRRMLARTTLETPPGEIERYSDLGFLLLEWMCESASGRTFGDDWHELLNEVDRAEYLEEALSFFEQHGQ